MKKFNSFKKAILFLTSVFVFAIFGQNAFAYDFSTVNNDGKTIYYNITSSANHEVAVTYDYADEYSGNIVIPSSVTYNETNYSVTTIGIVLLKVVQV